MWLLFTPVLGLANPPRIYQKTGCKRVQCSLLYHPLQMYVYVACATCTHVLDDRWSITLVPLVGLLTRRIKLKNDARGCALHYSWMRLQMFSASWFLFIMREFGHGSNPGEEDEWIRTGAAKAMTSWQSVTGCGLKVLPHTWCAHTTASLAAKKMSKLDLNTAVSRLTFCWYLLVSSVSFAMIWEWTVRWLSGT